MFIYIYIVYIYTVGFLSSRSKFAIPCLGSPLMGQLGFEVFVIAGLGLGFHKVGRTKPVDGISSMIYIMFWMMTRYDDTWWYLILYHMIIVDQYVLCIFMICKVICNRLSSLYNESLVSRILHESLMALKLTPQNTKKKLHLSCNLNARVVFD